jgi:hypothetical protein
MKFLKYLIENPTGYDKFLEELKKDCAPFLHDLQHSKFLVNILYRGTKDILGQYQKKDVRTDRKPSETDVKIHNYADEFFYKKYDVKLRSETIFCSTSPSIAMDYGKIYVIFPVGKYDIYYSDKVRDFYTDLEELFNKKGLGSAAELLNNQLTDPMKKIIDSKIKTYKKMKVNDNLGQNECMVHCKQYYAIDIDLFESKASGTGEKLGIEI